MAELRVNPVIIPRGAGADRRLNFYLVFSFVADCPPGTHGCAELHSTLADWPKVVARHFPYRDEKGTSTTFLRLTVGGKLADVPILREPGSSPEEKNWTDGQASGAWRDLVRPTVEMQSKAESRGTLQRRSSELAQAYLDRKAIKPNPAAASDLRPGFRLESPDTREMAEAFTHADMLVKYESGGEAARSVMEILGNKSDREVHARLSEGLLRAAPEVRRVQRLVEQSRNRYRRSRRRPARRVSRRSSRD